jgi:hypothetical protein
MEGRKHHPQQTRRPVHTEPLGAPGLAGAAAGGGGGTATGAGEGMVATVVEQVAAFRVVIDRRHASGDRLAVR